MYVFCFFPPLSLSLSLSWMRAYTESEWVYLSRRDLIINGRGVHIREGPRYIGGLFLVSVHWEWNDGLWFPGVLPGGHAPDREGKSLWQMELVITVIQARMKLRIKLRAYKYSVFSRAAFMECLSIVLFKWRALWLCISVLILLRWFYGRWS